MCFFPFSSDDGVLIICILAFDGQQQLVLLANRSNGTRPNIYFYSSDYRQGWQRRTADGQNIVLAAAFRDADDDDDDVGDDHDHDATTTATMMTTVGPFDSLDKEIIINSLN